MAENIAAQDFDMRRFSQRLQECSKDETLPFFKQTLKQMSSGERERHFDEMVQLFTSALQKHCRKIEVCGLDYVSFAFVYKKIEGTFDEFLRIVLDQSGGGNSSQLVVNLVRKTKEAVVSDLILPSQRELAEYVLSCVSGEVWCDIRGSKLLMEDLWWPRERTTVLLKYGFPYSYDWRYFNDLCLELDVGLMIKGEYLPREVGRNIFRSERSLRLQMALEILVAGVFPNRWIERIGIPSLIWKTVPHPFISSTEMFQLMAPFFANFPQKLQDLCEHYAQRNNVFEVPEVTSPRSLVHLSRVQVRRNLLDTKNLNDGAIDSLDIPRSLKGYLKLDSF